MTYDHELTLISEEYDYTKPDPGPYVTKKTVLANKKSATRSERSAAAIRDIHPAYVFTISKWDYDRESVVEFTDDWGETVKYEVYDTYDLDDTDEIELKTRATIGGN